VSRRTLIHKLTEIAACLSQFEQPLTANEQQKVELRLSELIAQAWHTNEIREQRPTPVDEAKSGFAVIESSVWQALPDFLRELDADLNKALGTGLPLDAAPKPLHPGVNRTLTSKEIMCKIHTTESNYRLL
jgi:phosphoenolpyruvate carboxylase